VLTVDTADLDVVSVGNFLESGHVSGKLGELDVDGGTEGSTEVGGAGGDVTEMVVVSELADGLDMGGGAGKAIENGTDVSTLLHGDDTELILFVNPDEESLGIVMVNTTAFRPVTLETAGLEVLVATLEKEMVLNESVTLRISHGFKRVVGSLEFAGKVAKSLDDLAFEFLTVVTGDGGTKGVLSRVTSNADTGRVNHLVLISGEVRALQVSVVHVNNVLVCRLVTVIRLNDLVHEGSEVIVRFVRTSINTNTRVGPLGTGENRLLKGVAVLVFAVLALLPDIAGKALVEQRAGSSREVREVSDIVR